MASPWVTINKLQDTPCKGKTIKRIIGNFYK